MEAVERFVTGKEHPVNIDQDRIKNVVVVGIFIEVHGIVKVLPKIHDRIHLVVNDAGVDRLEAPQDNGEDDDTNSNNPRRKRRFRTRSVPVNVGQGAIF